MATFTTVSKPRLKWEAPTVSAADQDYFLDIGDGFNLLIATGQKLIIQPGQGGTTWTPITRTPTKY